MSIPHLSFNKRPSRGFTLIEMLVVIAILGIMAAIAIPSFQDMLANQRVRSAATDLVSDITLARTEAIKRQQRVQVLADAAGWRNGWTVQTVNGAIMIKSSNGMASGTGLAVATVGGITGNEFQNAIIFRGDGTVLNAPIGAEAGLSITDGPAGNQRSRAIYLSPTGRTSVEIIK